MSMFSCLIRSLCWSGACLMCVCLACSFPSLRPETRSVSLMSLGCENITRE